MKRALLFLVLLAGCSPKPVVHVKDAPDQVPPGWTMTQSADLSVRLAVPPGWRHGVDRMGSMDLGSFQEGSIPPELQQMSSDFNKAADDAEQQELEALQKKGILIHVINEGAKPIPGEARTRFYVLKKSQGSPMKLEEAAEIEAKHYAFRPKYETIKLPIGEAIRCKTTDELRDGGVRHEISYVVVDGNDMYALRFVTQEAEQTISAIAEQVAQSLRIKPSG